MMAGERFQEATLSARLRDLDSKKHLRVSLTYGTLFARGYGDAYDVLIFGRGGGFTGRYTMEYRELYRHVAAALDAGEPVYTGYELIPDRYVR